MGKYLWETLAHSRNQGDIAWHLLGDRPDLPFHVPPGVNADVCSFECPGFRFHTWEQMGLPYHTARLKPSLLHCPAMSLPWWQPVPTVVTLHDAMPWIESEMAWPPGFYRDRLLPRAFEKCAAMITVSESSRHDILRLWPELDTKLRVIPNGVSDLYLSVRPGPVSERLASLGVRRPYLLYVGGEIPRKRLTWALQVFEALGEPNLSLVVCGLDERHREGVTGRVRPDRRGGVVLLPFVHEEEMPCLYMNAVAVIYPTLYEGFGLPALEAQAVGTPVLFSEVSGLSDLRGPGAIVMPQYELAPWIDRVRELVRERQVSQRPDEDARRWARSFSWAASARRTLAIYEEVISVKDCGTG